MSQGSRIRDAASGPSGGGAGREGALRLRAGLLGAVRGYFTERGYLEVETPVIVPRPIPEPHIDYIEASYGVLQPSPEVYMKRLLAEGHSRIFQVARCFRGGERGDRHLPEFTLLEWYRSGATYLDLMEECEGLIRFAAGCLGRGPVLDYLGRVVDLRLPWRRMTVAQAFLRHSPETLEEVLLTGRFEEVLVSRVEPVLGTPCPVFLHDYPASMASLSRFKADDPSLCERVELYMGGLEIANGFSELTDPGEQLRRFRVDSEARRKSGRKVYRAPEAFLKAVKSLPASAGMALGIDRLVMVLAGCESIDEVVAFTPEDGW
jgi:elongation factor P--(R)-beta-lysine ligase